MSLDNIFKVAQISGLVITSLGVLIAAKSLAATQRHRKADTLLRIIAKMEEDRAARHIVYSLQENSDHWDETEKKAADAVCRSFDVLGYLYREGLVPDSLLTGFYAVPCARCWVKCRLFVFALRDQRNQPRHFLAFEELAKRALALRPDALPEGAAPSARPM